MTTYFGTFMYSDAKTCETIKYFLLKPLSVCQGTTGMNSNVITGYYKNTCGTNSASYVYYDVSDPTCTTPMSSLPVPDYGMCPTSKTSPKSVCVASADVSTLVKGMVFT